MPQTSITTVTIQGAVTGMLWMPACQGMREEKSSYTLRGPDRPFYPRVESIREAIERTAAKDGDFQSAGKLTADTLIIIKKQKGNRTVERSWNVLDFEKALADYVAPDVFMSDFYGEEG